MKGSFIWVTSELYTKFCAFKISRKLANKLEKVTMTQQTLQTPLKNKQNWRLRRRNSRVTLTFPSQ